MFFGSCGPIGTEESIYSHMNDWPMPTPEEAILAIEEWRSIDHNGASDSDLEAAVRKLIDTLKYIVVPCTSRINYSYCRVRRFCADSWPWCKREDLLAPPSTASVRYGRCNIPGESVLYCTRHRYTALREMRIMPGERFVSIEYKSVGEHSLARIARPLDPNPENEPPLLMGDQLLAYQILREFVRVEFTRQVAKDSDVSYKVSNALCNGWFNANSYDGWIYPSIAAHGQENVAFKAGAAERLITEIEADLCEMLPTTNVGQFEANWLMKAEVNSRSVEWAHMPSPAMQVSAPPGMWPKRPVGYARESRVE